MLTITFITGANRWNAQFPEGTTIEQAHQEGKQFFALPDAKSTQPDVKGTGTVPWSTKLKEGMEITFLKATGTKG